MQEKWIWKTQGNWAVHLELLLEQSKIGHKVLQTSVVKNAEAVFACVQKRSGHREISLLLRKSSVTFM